VSPQLAEQLDLLPLTAGWHLKLVVLSLGIAVLVSLPLAVALTRAPRLRAVTLGAVGMIQTIPSLALLALMVPTIAALNQLFGTEMPALGLPPVLIALTGYALLPILRNAVTGLTGVDRSLIEAARGLGMTPRQTLVQVELPLAAPVIFAGLRTAAVWTVGMATLATPVGQLCLGNHIFTGLQTRNWTAVLVGCVAAAILATALDGLMSLAERLPIRVVAPVAALGVALAAVPWSRPAPDAVVVGSKPFTEQYVLGHVLEQQLSDAGFETAQRTNLGSTVAFDALVAGEIDVYVDYTGTLWATLMKRTDTAPGDVVLDQVTAWVQSEHGVVCLGGLGFENAYAMATRRDTGWTSLDQVSGAFTVGSDLEFFARPEWRALRDGYGWDDAAQRTYDAALMYDALVQGHVDVIPAYSTDGRVAAYDLVLLDDPLDALPPYDAVLLVGPHAPDGVAHALEPLIGAIDADAMRQANKRVDLDGESLVTAAQWLMSTISEIGAEPR
jgi:osmoprotectant transport system permease protein